MEKKQILKVGMLFMTTAKVDLTITDIDGSPRYEKLGDNLYFRDYSKEYDDTFWNMLLIKQEFDLDCKKFKQKHPNDDFEPTITLLVSDNDGNMLKGIRLEYK